MICACERALRRIVSNPVLQLRRRDLGDEQELAPAEDGAQRRPQLVRDDGQELVFEPARLLGFVAGRALVFEQAFALLPLVVNVGQRADPALNISLRIPDGRHAALGPAPGAVVPAVAELDEVPLAAEDRGLMQLDHRGEVLRMDQLEVAAHREIFLGPSGIGVPLRIEILIRAVVMPHPGHAGHPLGEGAEQRLGLAPPLLGLLPRRNVLDHGDEVGLFVRQAYPVDGDGEVDPDDRAVLAEIALLEREGRDLAGGELRLQGGSRRDVVGMGDRLEGGRLELPRASSR